MHGERRHPIRNSAKPLSSWSQADRKPQPQPFVSTAKVAKCRMSYTISEDATKAIRAPCKRGFAALQARSGHGFTTKKGASLLELQSRYEPSWNSNLEGLISERSEIGARGTIRSLEKDRRIGYGGRILTARSSSAVHVSPASAQHSSVLYMAPAPDTPNTRIRSSDRPRRRHISDSAPASKKLKYVPGGPEGGGRYVDDEGVETPVGGTGPGGYAYIGPTEDAHPISRNAILRSGSPSPSHVRQEPNRPIDQLSEDEVLRSMARRRKSDKPGNVMHTCSECHREFKRPCDLTKHEKTHSRPWKCPEKKCKYFDFGWPTEQERDRHVNDKHSTAPVLYKCLYPPCPYASKRESNCKMHMEKAHHWVYIRSKKNGHKRVLRQVTPIHSFPSKPRSVSHTPPRFLPSPEVPMLDEFDHYSFGSPTNTSQDLQDVFSPAPWKKRYKKKEEATVQRLVNTHVLPHFD